MFCLYPNSDSVGELGVLRETNDPDSRFTNKAQRCHAHVKKNSPGVNAYAACTKSMGYGESYRSRSQRKAKEASEPVRIVTGPLVEMNSCHSKSDGTFCSTSGGGDVRKVGKASLHSSDHEKRSLATMKVLPKKHAGSPLHTNADINRQHAMTMFKAGMSPAQIAKAFPAVFKLTDGKLGQKYDYELADNSGRKETNRMITRTAVAAAIRKHKEPREGDAGPGGRTLQQTIDNLNAPARKRIAANEKKRAAAKGDRFTSAMVKRGRHSFTEAR